MILLVYQTHSDYDGIDCHSNHGFFEEADKMGIPYVTFLQLQKVSHKLLILLILTLKLCSTLLTTSDNLGTDC